MILQSRESTLECPCNIGLSPKEICCAKHKKQMKFNANKSVCVMFICKKEGNYEPQISVAHNILFESFMFAQLLALCSLIVLQ